MHPSRSRSGGWFLPQILLEIIGGPAACFVFRRDDPKKARNCLYLRAVLTAAMFVINLFHPVVVTTLFVFFPPKPPMP